MAVCNESILIQDPFNFYLPFYVVCAYSNVMVLCYINAFTTGNTLLCDMIFQADTYNICGTAETFNQNPKKNIFGDVSSFPRIRNKLQSGNIFLSQNQNSRFVAVFFKKYSYPISSFHQLRVSHLMKECFICENNVLYRNIFNTFFYQNVQYSILN